MHRWRLSIAWFGVAVLLALLGVVWRRETFEVTSWVAGVLALFVALAPEFRRFVSPEQATGSAAEQLALAADELAGAVLVQWDAEEKTRRLQDPWPLPVSWANTTRPIVDHWEVIRGRRGRPQPVQLDGEIDQIVDVFERVPSRRLVVLGPAGSGKSVLMLRLTLGLLGGRTVGERVPVLLHLSTWNPAEQGLHEWLAAQLVRDYPALQRTIAGTTTARELVTTGRLLPILDGFDEMPDDMRAKALLRINNSLAQGDPIVITSRATEYEAAVSAADVLTAAAVIDLQPLGLAEVAHYLKVTTPSHATAKWTALFGEVRLRPDDPLHAVLSVPLMVSLIRVAYSDTADDPAELLDRRRFDTVAALEDHLLDRLIPTVYRRDAVQPPLPPCSPESARRWLGFLARHIDGTGGDFAWWHLYRMLPVPIWLLSVGLASGVSTGVVAGVPVGFLLNARTGVLTGLAVMGAVGLASVGSIAVRSSIVWSARPLTIRIAIRGWLWSLANLVGTPILVGLGAAGAGVGVGLFLTGLALGWSRVDIAHPPWFASALGVVVGVPIAYLGYRDERRSRRQARPMPPNSVTIRMTGSLKPLLGRLVGGLPAGLAVGITAAVLDSAGWRAGLMLGGIAGVLAMLARPALGPNRPARVRIRSWKRLAAFLSNRIVAGFKLGFLVGIVSGSVAWTIGNVPDPLNGFAEVIAGGLVGAVLGATLGLLAGLGTGMADWSSVLTEAVTPLELLRLDRRATITFVGLFALTTGLAFTVPFVISWAESSGLVFAIATGAVLWCMVALLVAPGALGDWAWYQWVLAKITFPLCGWLPRGLLPFLMDAHRRGVLRQAGGVYQFRHARLLERLKA